MQLLADVGLVASGKQIKDALQRKAVVINGEEFGLEDNLNAPGVFSAQRALFGKYFLVKLGKKKHHLFVSA